MAEMSLFENRVIGAPAAVVYEIFADYANHHGRILPGQFSDLKVESGGRGAGSVISFKVRVAGSTRSVVADVTEPEPGRLLEERDRKTGAVTSFLVEPAEGGASRVRIETRWTPRGIQGVFERLFAAPMLRPIYKQELDNVEAYAAELSA
jgi:hypothetical protein